MGKKRAATKVFADRKGYAWFRRAGVLVLLAGMLSLIMLAQRAVAADGNPDGYAPYGLGDRGETISREIHFTAGELAYLRRKKEITMCVDPDWMPLESIQNGRHVGMTADYFALFRRELPVPIILVPTRNWSESIAFAKARKCDIFSLAMPTPERETYMNFTRPYLDIPLVMAARMDMPFIDDITSLTGFRIGVVKGYAFGEILRHRYPKMDIRDVASVRDGLARVAKGDLDGFIGTLATIGYVIQKEYASELKVAGKFDERWRLGVAARNDEPQLTAIFDKLIAAIPPRVHQEILNRWIAVKYVRGTDYRLLWQVLAVAGLVLGLLVWRNNGLRRYGRELEKRNQQIREQAQQLREAERKLNQAVRMEAIGTMAGGIAHDFNNILSAILGYAELVKPHLVPGSQPARDLDQVIRAGNRARKLVRQILTFSRMKPEKHHPVRPAPVVREAVDFVRASMPSTIEIRVDIDDRCPPIMATATGLNQVIVNLCTNALHAMEDGHGVLSVRLGTKESGPDGTDGFDGKTDSYVRIEVSDTGQGMDEETMEHIFEPYFTTRKTGKGSGMGLALVHGIVKGCGGVVRVSSVPGQGTTFSLYFPALDERVETGSGQEGRTESVALAGGKERVLIVDDEKDLVAMYRRGLEALGYTVDTCEDGQQALERMTRDPDRYDIVVTDMTMPRLTGLELIEQVRRIRPALPVILCTGFSPRISSSSADDLAIDKVLMKPVGIRDLVTAIRAVLDDPRA